MSLEAWGDEGWPDRFEAAREAGWLDPQDISNALIDVMNERDRQWNEEGWTPEHDDQHDKGELAGAAGCYALYRSHLAPAAVMCGDFIEQGWPWAAEWWKPTTARRDIVKAAALLIAEIERLDRAAALTEEPGR